MRPSRSSANTSSPPFSTNLDTHRHIIITDPDFIPPPPSSSTNNRRIIQTSIMQQQQQQQEEDRRKVRDTTDNDTIPPPTKKRQLSPSNSSEYATAGATTTDRDTAAAVLVTVDSGGGAARIDASPVQPPSVVSTGTDRDDRTSKDYYFDSYAHHAIHEEMLKDEVRTRTYEMAIMQNKHVFQDKIVLDVGCGTGILSMFAAKAGAKHVYAVDCSSIVHQARQIVELNGFSDTITIIQGKAEEIELPVPKVDVIVSEWMGYFLLYESMLDTVLFARDKWLVQDGVIFPDKAVMYLAALEDGQVKSDRIDFWTNVYGFDMSPLREIALKEPVVDVVEAKSIVTDPVPILHLDILTCTKEDLEFVVPFQLFANRNDYVHGLVAYFECAFTQVHKPIGFSTSPFCRYTHWKQTIFYLEDSLVVCKGESLSGEVECKPNKKNPRDLDIGISLSFHGRHSNVDKHIEYRLR